MSTGIGVHSEQETEEPMIQSKVESVLRYEETVLYSRVFGMLNTSIVHSKLAPTSAPGIFK